mgnify:CR=1 FL=1
MPWAQSVERMRGRDDAGMVTLEIALAIPVLLAVTLAFVHLTNVVRLEAMAQDAARAAARELARGVDRREASRVAQRILPAATVNSSVSGAEARVTVTKVVTGPAPLLDRLKHRVSARAVSALEPPP